MKQIKGEKVLFSIERSTFPWCQLNRLSTILPDMMYALRQMPCDISQFEQRTVCENQIFQRGEIDNFSPAASASTN